MCGGDGLQGVIGRAPGAHQTRPAINRCSDLQVSGLAPGAVAIQVEATRLMSQQVQQRACKGHRDDKRQAMISNTQCANLLLPLLQRACLADRRQLRPGFIKMLVFGVRADLLFGQKEGVGVPIQARYQTCALGAVEAAEITCRSLRALRLDRLPARRKPMSTSGPSTSLLKSSF